MPESTPSHKRTSSDAENTAEFPAAKRRQDGWPGLGQNMMGSIETIHAQYIYANMKLTTTPIYDEDKD